ncbi:aspartyl protease family protein At5g10770-like [Vicia villosa]|uniref:aspartyl protease family protein At5g10770-like n=1 Tax=Vicia villosa TaxID=3911 RepID=UPI00273B2E20|nr:aspartyl protease family protein At5g10770-like [Vicia villosa]
MAFQMSQFFFVSIAVFLFFFLQNSFAIETTLEERHHLVQTSSLLPSSSCSSSTEGPNRKASLDVIHKHGPCSQLNSNGKANYVETHSDLLNHDKERINYIHSKLSSSSSSNNNNKMKEIELDSSSSSTNLPAKSGDLIGSGNYYVVLGLGTPKKDLSLAFDTGSDLTWTQCQPCATFCYNQTEEIFDPSKSTTYSNITCTSPDCTQLLSATGIKPGCSKSTQACIYGIQYGDRSFSVGYFSHEQLTITPTDTVDNFLFGCGQDNEGLFNGIAGLLGLGRDPISFVQQTSQKYDKTFSYCLPSTSSEVGHLTFGTTDKNEVSYTQSPTHSDGNSFYYLDIVGISVGGTQLPISSSLFSSGGAIIDSGTVITWLPPTVYASLRDSFKEGMSKYPNASAFSILDTCYDLSGTEVVSIPKVNFLLGGGVTVELVGSGILYVVSLKQVCLAFAANGADSDLTIFGNVQQRTLEVVYDVGGGRIGFGSNGCE